MVRIKTEYDGTEYKITIANNRRIYLYQCLNCSNHKRFVRISVGEIFYDPFSKFQLLRNHICVEIGKHGFLVMEDGDSIIAVRVGTI